MPELTDCINASAHAWGDFAQKCRQEIYVLSTGTVGGATKEFSKHPIKTIGDTACMGVAAVGLTAVAAAELPVVSIVAAGTGAVYGASFAWDLINPQSPHNIERNLSLRSAMATAWTTSDTSTLQNSILELQEKAGPDALQVFQSLAVGGAAGKYGLKTVNMVYSAGRFGAAAVAADGSISNGVRFGTNLKVPTWDEYVNFSRRHGPVIQKTIHQFELERILQTSAKGSSKENSAGVKEEDKAETKFSTQKTEPAQKHDEKESERGSSLYFGERFGHYHH
ncbi:MAG: hypothetical protein P4L53_20470 [Candidatus Obscuribacterales bacterium]|nr:hypothetical protein [Candidatus Obscuribacterales bacterium]